MEKKSPLRQIVLIPAVFLALLVFSHETFGESKFRQDFTKSYMGNNFTALEYLVKNNKDIIPGEVKSLLQEALSGEKSYEDKMNLLDIANAMASMYSHWHGDDKPPLAEVEAAQRAEIKKENERVAELQKWNQYELFPGNFVMRDHQAELNAKGLAPVIYPHWVHRLLYECKSCHQNIFVMKRGANGISQAKILEGKQCGTCHNGKVSFSANENCEKCHMAGKPGEESLRMVNKYDLKKIKDAAARLNTSFSPEKLPKGALPLDRFGFIDWDGLKKANACEPVKSLVKDAREETRDNVILFESNMAGIKGVLFNHKTHSSRATCESCHQEIFKDTLGANKVTMMEMSAGKVCGACHGKVAFKFADCNRCHERPQGAPADGALARNASASAGK